MPKRWRIRPHDSQRIADLERAAGVSPVLAQLLICRGLDDPKRARDFLDVKLSQLRDPSELPGATLAAEKVVAAIRGRRRIVIYGDYDVDGVSAASLLWQCLKLLGANVGYYVPHRIDEGYGLNDEALTSLARQGAQQIITVDCGITSIREAETARDLGLELIVTDHHEFSERLPAAAAIVHPRLPGTAYPFAGLSGAGVAFKLAWAVCQEFCGARRVNERLKEFLVSAVGIAALGTVADVVPLIDENRVLVQHGLAGLAQRPGVGLAALLKLASLDSKRQLDSDDIGFAIAPRLNAAGRLGQAQLAIELLITESADRAVSLAEYINELNGSRQSLERSILLAASKQAQQHFDAGQDAALVLADHDWHPGVIGIVAGRLAEKYHRPVVLIALDPVGVKPGVGSGRSVPGFNLHSALSACGQHLTSFGGHAAAAGLKVEEARLGDFRADFCEYAASNIDHKDRTAELWIDAEVPLGALTLRTLVEIERLAPFGPANPRPLFCTSRVRLAEPPKRIGGGGRHLSLKLCQHNVAIRGVAFGAGDWAEELPDTDSHFDVAFRPVQNDFRGRKTVELQVVDWRLAEVAAPV